MAAEPDVTARNAPPRIETRRLVAGRGTYTGDLLLPGMLHVVFLRSPHAHARIGAIGTAAAAAMPGVVAVVTAADLAPLCRPFHTVVAHVPDHISPPQPPLAEGVARWQGEAVAAVVAATRAQAEDAAEHIEIEWQPLPAVADPLAALAAGADGVHAAPVSNCALERTFGSAAVEQGLAAAAGAGCKVVERDFVFARHTGVPLEARVMLADYNAAEDSLVVYQSTQVPNQMQDTLSRLLGIPEHRVRVVCRDVGGAFGIKLHAYPDELAVAAIAKLVGRPIRFVCDRTEAFATDVHARDFRVTARLAAAPDGAIPALDTDIVCVAGAYSIYPRASIGDGILAAMMMGAPYRVAAQRAHLRVAYQNKVPTGSYRGVGQPISCAVTEVMIDEAAHALGQDPVAFRRKAYHRAAALPLTTAGGLKLEAVTLEACLDRVVAMMRYDELRAEQAALRARGVVRGIGVVTFIEQTAPGAWLYGPAAIRVSAQDGAIVRLDPAGGARVSVGCSDQGQGTLTGIAQIVGEVLGLGIDRIAVDAGDSAGPYGGGAWASRGLSVSGEAAHRAATDLKAQLLMLAGLLLQADAAALDLRGGEIVEREGGTARMALAELAGIAHFRPDLLPPGVHPELAMARSYIPRSSPYFTANGVQGSYLEVDTETGTVTLLKHWVAEDCGRVINAALVDGQLRGGVAQGLGAALSEHCIYDEDGQLLTGSLMDYALPRADTTPEIEIAHIESRQPGTALGIKGAGEAGTIGAGAAVWCALNDALRPLGARMNAQPFTAPAVLAALRAARPQ